MRSNPAAAAGVQVLGTMAVSLRLPLPTAEPPLTPASSAIALGGEPDVALAAAGDRTAFERLYRANVNRVFAICARMSSDRAGAEELTQDVFVRAWEKIEQFRGESLFSTWLHRLAVNVVLNARKGEGRRRSRLEAGTEMDELPHQRPTVDKSPLLDKACDNLYYL